MASWLLRLHQPRQRIGMVIQQFNLFPHMTVEGNVMEGLRTVKRLSRELASTRALAELETIGLADKATLNSTHRAQEHNPFRCA